MKRFKTLSEQHHFKRLPQKPSLWPTYMARCIGVIVHGRCATQNDEGDFDDDDDGDHTSKLYNQSTCLNNRQLYR